MGIVRPTGRSVERMLDPGGWPEIDENIFYDRAQEFALILRQVTEVLETCQYQHYEIFEGGIWLGDAADAAGDELGTDIDRLRTLRNGLATVIDWHNHIAGLIVQAKCHISDNVEGAYKQINALKNDSSLGAAKRTTAIKRVVRATHEANVSVVVDTGEQILATQAWAPEPVVEPTPVTPTPVTPTPVTPTPVTPTPVTPTPVTPSPVTPTPVTPPSPGPQPVSPEDSPHTPSPSVPGAPGHEPAAPASPAASTARPSSADGRGKGVAPASAQDSSSPLLSMPMAPTAPGGAGAVPGAGGGAGPGAGSGARSGAPVGQKPSDKQTSTRPAAATTRSVARTRPVARPESSDRTESAHAAAMAPIPVSPARAERDAIAEASAADAARRRGTDPLRLARRIAAALNAPGSGGRMISGSSG